MPAPDAARPRRLRPSELTETAILVDVTVALEVAGFLLPLGGVLQALAVVPLAALAWRQRPRAVVLGTATGAWLSFLVGGLSLAVTVAASGMIGLVVGAGLRRRWSTPRIAAISVASVALPGAGLTVAGLEVLGSLRHLTLAQLRVSWRGMAHLLGRLGLGGIVGWGNNAVSWSISHWWLTIPAGELALVVWVVAASLVFAAPVLQRLADATGYPGAPVSGAPVSGAPAPGRDGTRGDGGGARGGHDRAGEQQLAPAPVPVRLLDVSYLYPGGERAALSGVSLDLPAAMFVVVRGPNGSGKSTLVKILAERLIPTGGRVERAGAAGVGLVGGTAVVAQRPESQVIGVRVIDDVSWGLPEGEQLDTAALLELVGLAGMEDRETSTLSGGQLQRLAVAAALARRPALLLADEATAMLDPGGRRGLTTLLRRLAREHGITTVLVTHHRDETDQADLAMVLDDGRLVSVTEGPVAAVRPSSGARARPPAMRSRPDDRAGAPPLIRLVGVGHVYARGSPWAHRALDGVDLDVFPGDAVLVTGVNGSGKSTLAWVLAGLLAPSEGRVLASDERSGRPLAGIGFQHARLQVVRATVAEDVSWGTTLEADGVARALAQVGLEPEELAHRQVDSLSGGQLRRVALAGLLAREPRLIVLDEPLAGLDDQGADALVKALDRLRRDRGIATVVVSHEQEESARLARRLLVMDQGRLVETKAVERAGSQGLAGSSRGGGLAAGAGMPAGPCAPGDGRTAE